jgi:serpin B
MRSRLLPLLLALPALAHGAAPAPDHRFAGDLYKTLASHEKGNLFFSPASVSVALSMTREGARGDTRAQMDQVLGAGGALALDGGKEVELRLANRLWLQAGYAFEQPFLDGTAKLYGAHAEIVDFRGVGAAEQARKKINDWVEGQTNHKILDLIPPKGVDEYTRLVLANAIYFKGKWATQFDKKETHDQPFFLDGKRSVKAPLMHAHAHFGYLRDRGVQIVSLPYKGGALDMVLIVPDAKDGLAEVEQHLALDRWLRPLYEDEVDLSMPRFKATYAVMMNDALRDLGMKDAFDQDKADFSGIADPAKTRGLPLYIAAVFHKAFVDVNEEGTEAAAATAVVMAEPDAVHEVPVVRADHPFLYLIREHKSGQILFMGRVVDPTAS